MASFSLEGAVGFNPVKAKAREENEARLRAQRDAEWQRYCQREPLDAHDLAERVKRGSWTERGPSLLEQLAWASSDPRKQARKVEELLARTFGYHNWHAGTAPNQVTMEGYVRFALQRRGYTGMGKKLVSRIARRVILAAEKIPAPKPGG